MDIYNNLNVAGDVKANKVNLNDSVTISVGGITNSGLQYCFPACSGTIATQSYVDEKTCGIVIDAYTKAEVDEKVNCLEGSIASVETDVSSKASQFCLTCHEAKVGGASQIGHVKVASSFGSSETCVVPSLSLVCSTLGSYVTTTCFNAYKNTTTCNFNFTAGCIEGVRCYVEDVESDLMTAKQDIQQNALDIADLQALSGCLKNVYTETQVDELLNNKADFATTLDGYGITDAYTKSEVDNSLLSKADKSEIPDISTKADSATTLAGYGISDAYTKSEVDDIVSSIDVPDAFCSINTEYPVENFTFRATDTSSFLYGQSVFIGCTACSNNAVLIVNGCIKSSSGLTTDRLEGCSLSIYHRPTIDGCINCMDWDCIGWNSLVSRKDIYCFVTYCIGLCGGGFCSINANYCTCNLNFFSTFNSCYSVTIGCSCNSTALTVCGPSYFGCRPMSQTGGYDWSGLSDSALVTKTDVKSYVESQLSGASSSNICGLSSSEYQSLVSSGSVKANTLYVIV